MTTRREFFISLRVERTEIENYDGRKQRVSEQRAILCSNYALSAPVFDRSTAVLFTKEAHHACIYREGRCSSRSYIAIAVPIIRLYTIATSPVGKSTRSHIGVLFGDVFATT